MGGLGKTTLAKLAYNDTDQFDLKAWVHVSHDFDLVRVTKCIIEAITNAKYKLGSLDPMQCRLHELVKEKKLLLVLDDAWVIMGNISIRIQEKIVTKRPTEETRHVSLFCKVVNQILLKELGKSKSLHTLSIVDASFDEVLKQIGHSFERMRVLDLNGFSIQEIPESIGNLKHLRHLDLQHSRIESLPYSICSLHNLQTLNLNDCNNLLELPCGIGSLINLRYLLLKTTRLQVLPDSLCKLEKLQEIDLLWCDKFVVLPTNIGNLNNLRYLMLSRTRIEMLPASLCKLEKLQEIDLSFCMGLRVLPTHIGDLNNLHSLNIEGTSVEKLPDSICRLYNL
ncbi:disease resistance protein RUN1-like [Aristolochia californica]|uniref:disease resistance protein RUN1-like n=1 Tax=Aristolochia californica TaxID=171875 RepID=UPI0035D79347